MSAAFTSNPRIDPSTSFLNPWITACPPHHLPGVSQVPAFRKSLEGSSKASRSRRPEAEDPPLDGDRTSRASGESSSSTVLLEGSVSSWCGLGFRDAAVPQEIPGRPPRTGNRGSYEPILRKDPPHFMNSKGTWSLQGTVPLPKVGDLETKDDCAKLLTVPFFRGLIRRTFESGWDESLPLLGSSHDRRESPHPSPQVRGDRSSFLPMEASAPPLHPHPDRSSPSTRLASRLRVERG